MGAQRTTFVFVVLISAALAGGYVLGRSVQSRTSTRTTTAVVPRVPSQVYTCSMHPQVRLDRPGNCPICAMPLVPESAATSDASGGESMLRLSDHAAAMAKVETTPVTRRELSRELRAVGKVQYNESSLATVTARVDGYGERLFVNFTGVEIKAGDHLAEIYSPALLNGQQEYLMALRDGDGPWAELSKFKLKRWGLTDEQLAALAKNKQVTDRVTLYSPISGTVIEKPIIENSAFKAGDVLYRVANLDTVWVYLDVYEYDLAWVRFGQRVEVTAEALPGRVFSGTVTFVQPVVDDQTRTIRIPVNVDNGDHVLKPGMFVTAALRARLDASGAAAPTGVEGRYSCVMHPMVLRDEPGKCPVCEMPLERIPGAPGGAAAAARRAEGHAGHPGDAVAPSPATASTQPADVPALPLALPVTAVLDSGNRRIVYVERSPGLFESREVVLGPRAGEFFPVLGGIAEGERVVTRGGFLLDSQVQITGRPSLYYPGGLTAGAGAHRHGAGDATPPAPAAPPAGPRGHEH